jgi:DNA invertase Pin-like site-specific DNA recombinase
MKTQIIGYVRVSTLDQNTERQLEGIDLDISFEDKASGKDTNRPQLQAALKHARLGDIFMVHSMDRLARNVEDMLRLVRELNSKGVTVQFMKENMIFSVNQDDPRSMLMFTMLSAFSQFERALIKERQREGIALAKRKGIYTGRKRALDPIQAEELLKGIGEGTPKTVLAKRFGISRETVYQYAKQSVT